MKGSCRIYCREGSQHLTDCKEAEGAGIDKNESIFKILSKVNGYDGTYKSGTHLVSET